MSGSRPLVGSSRISSSGSWKSAWISPIFWRLPARELAEGPIQVGLEALRQAGARPRPLHAAHLREERDQLAARQARVIGEVAGEVPEAGADREAVAPGVEAEQAGRAAGRVQQVQQGPDRRRLARPVGPEEPEDLARGHGHRDVLDPALRAVALGQTLGLDHRALHAAKIAWRRAPVMRANRWADSVVGARPPLAWLHAADHRRGAPGHARRDRRGDRADRAGPRGAGGGVRAARRADRRPARGAAVRAGPARLRACEAHARAVRAAPRPSHPHLPDAGRRIAVHAARAASSTPPSPPPPRPTTRSPRSRTR